MAVSFVEIFTTNLSPMIVQGKCLLCSVCFRDHLYRSVLPCIRGCGDPRPMSAVMMTRVNGYDLRVLDTCLPGEAMLLNRLDP